MTPGLSEMLAEAGKLTLLHDGSRFTEGPVWFADLCCLIWSDIPNDRMLCWRPDGGVGLFRQPSHFANGNTRDRQGRLITCEHGARRVTRTEPDGTISVIADRYQGGRLNSPNDAVVKSDGTIWFTDPDYGLRSNPPGSRREQDHDHVFCADPATGSLRPVVSNFDKPNGLAFSPDETRLYIADSAVSDGADRNSHIRVFDVAPDNTLSGGEVFVTTIGIPDGMRVDRHGNLWTSAGPKIDVYAPDATLLGQVAGFPADVTNLTFGGPENDMVFVTAGTALYSFKVRVRGCQWP